MNGKGERKREIENGSGKETEREKGGGWEGERVGKKVKKSLAKGSKVIQNHTPASQGANLYYAFHSEAKTRHVLQFFYFFLHFHDNGC